jgi:hypothetical protein
MKILIYALVDPRNGKAHYVGQTSDRSRRLSSHIREQWIKNTDKARWIRELGELGLEPEMRSLERVDWMEAGAAERRWINHFVAGNTRLLNVADGGAGCSITAGNQHTPSDWAEFGEAVKNAEAALAVLHEMAGSFVGAKGMDKIQKVKQQLSRAKGDFEEIVSRRFPGWSDVVRVFYGPNSPKLPDPEPVSLTH